ncbi:MAG: transcriptional regulator [Holophagales bacterium]|nr:transcriptional regulator [Holophagales bacterium]
MPLYEFRCESCGHETETIMLFSDPLPTICETCGGPLKKLLSAPAVQFKGSGFYLTDYGRSGSAANPGARDKDAASVAAEAKSSGDAKAGSETKSSGEGRSSGDGKASGDGKSSGEGKASGEAKTSGEKSGTASVPTAGSGGNAKTAG